MQLSGNQCSEDPSRIFSLLAPCNIGDTGGEVDGQASSSGENAPTKGEIGTAANGRTVVKSITGTVSIKPRPDRKRGFCKALSDVFCCIRPQRDSRLEKDFQSRLPARGTRQAENMDSTGCAGLARDVAVCNASQGAGCSRYSAIGHRPRLSEDSFASYCFERAMQAKTHLPNGYGLPELQKHVEIVLDIARSMTDEIPWLSNKSLYSMASALYHAEINTLEEAKRLGLVIVPPGPIFHTWYALHGTTLFNGKNNLHGYDYLKTIEKEAEYLKAFQLPVLFVYSILEMSDEQSQEMSRLFKAHDNIISICLESDFPEHRMVSALAKIENKLHRSDAIRYLALMYKDEVLNMAAKKARASDKHRIADCLDKHKGRTLVYSDIDNVIIRPDLHMLTSSATGPICCRNPNTENLEYLIKKRHLQAEMPKKHYDYLRHIIRQDGRLCLNDRNEAREKNDRLHDALLSTYLSPENTSDFRWNSESGHWRLGKENSVHIDLQNPDPKDAFSAASNSFNWDDRKKLYALEGMQQLLYFHVNYHRSWH